MNVPLFSAIYSIAATVIIGVLMIVLFVNYLGSATYIIGAVIIGALISLPVALMVTKKLSQTSNSPSPVQNK